MELAKRGLALFTYDKEALADFEAQLLHWSGILLGALKYLGESDKKLLTIDLISNEAIKTSEIEGEILDRDSIQS